jgi:RNA polymerase sigma-70 factor (ECF subfamily)
MKDALAADHQDPEGGRRQGPLSGAIQAEALFRAHAPFVAGFLHRLGVPSADVDDVLQEVFLVAHRKGGFVPGAGQPRTWLAAIAVRLARSSHRSRARHREDADERALDSAAGQGSPEEALDQRGALSRVQRALDTLDLDHRAAFVLYEIEGESCERIASSLGVPVGTVYSRLHYARRRFQDAYAELDPGHQALQPRLAEGA